MSDKNDKGLIWQRVKNGVQKYMPSTPESQAIEGDTLPTDTAEPIRLGYRVLGIGLGLFFLWAIFAPLDEGVPATASVALDTKRKAVQHPLGGIVREVLVREGQMVKEGDTLIRLDEASTQANYASIRQHYMAVRALESRLLAEQHGSSAITFHPDLIAAKNDPFVKQHMDNQEKLFQARKQSINASLQGVQHSIQGQQASYQSYTEMLPQRRSQLASMQDELKGLRELVQEGYAPRSKQMEMERQVNELNASIAELGGNSTRTSRAIDELRTQATQRQQEYHKEVDGQLAEVRREVEADSDKLKAATDELARVEIKSPATGQVVGLVAQTVGGVVQPSQKLMDIVPENGALLMEIHIPPNLIDHVRGDLDVDVRFSAFSHSPQLVVQGKMLSVSGDLIQDQNPQIPAYYLGRALITPDGMKKLGKRTMYPGMPAEVIIKTGRRSMLTYLLHPLLKRVAASMTEE